jgi:hypothetical protein
MSIHKNDYSAMQQHKMLDKPANEYFAEISQEYRYPKK